MELHSLVFLGIGIVAFGYWLRAVDFLPHRREPETIRHQPDLGLNKTW
jgi:hypothetical protein